MYYTNGLKIMNQYINEVVCVCLLSVPQKFNLLKMEWPEDYSLEKVFPLMSLWHLTHVTNGSKQRKVDHLMLESFVKTRTRQGVSCIEVQWVRPGEQGQSDLNCVRFEVCSKLHSKVGSMSTL